MKTIKNIFLAMLIILTISCTSDDYHEEVPDLEQTQLRVIGKGTAVAQLKIINNPDTGQPIEAFCFLMELINAETGEIIGTLEDCDMGTTENSDGTLISKIVTKFIITNEGSIISRGDVLQKPIGDERFSTEFTPFEDNIVEITGDFEGMKGRTTLIGEVDLSQFDQNIITFNCNFTIDLETH
ncbi:hypothetical protein [Ulvibacter antarcticus]|uniref:Allene oxide cyclase barrel-like domain-containing protein n=1 Tax=Ulvibacter antarcticus TaxID=442714 RepID=A0A3L9YBG7_9FLAO|nr:hypothetical protein [Ulvibacter antarcticus]RMA58083.1 hypothetical protein BXY75_2891 [Ulvibacter antarcticus]